ncbi:MAG: hypothetical protein ACU85V_12995 [Gammaproteobacteria bacterium]
MTKSLIGTALWAAALSAGAVETAARSPGDMTVEERMEMMSAANGYSTCVYEAALAQIDASPDIRQIADMAMGDCRGHLDSLGERITGWGFPEGFADGFTRNVRDKAARKILPELAIRKR